MAQLINYLKVLGGRAYRPIKPLSQPLLKKIRLIYFLGAFVVLGLVGSFWPINENYSRQIKAGWWPWSTKAHCQLALAWFNFGDEERAIKELQKANQLSRWQIIQAKADLKKTEIVVTDAEKIREEIRSWETVLQEKPDYRDVLLRLSLLTWQIKDEEKAQAYFQRAAYLDPNSPEVNNLAKIIFSQP